MKKIMFVSPTGTLDNGAEKSILQLMFLLIKHGHQVFNVYPENGHETAVAYKKMLESHGVKPIALKTLKWWWEEAPGERLGTSEEMSKFFHQDIYHIRKVVQENNIDLVISNTANVFQGAVAAACEKVPHFWLIHELPHREFQYYEKKIPFIEQFSQKVFSVTGVLYNELEKKIQTNLESFMPYSLINSSLLNKGDNIRLVSIGRLTKTKNHIELLRVYANNFSHMELLLIGGWDSEVKEACNQLIAEYNLDKVTFLGNVDNPWEYVTDTDICVFSSQMESFPLVYIESVLNGVPSIVSNNGGHLTVSEFIGYTDNIYQLYDEANLKNKIGQFIHSFEDVKQIFLQLKKRMQEKYTLHNCYENILKAVEHTSDTSSNTIKAISNLIGQFNFFEADVTSFYEYITIFYSENMNFSNEQSMRFLLKDKDVIEMNIPKDANYIRIDMGENYNVFKKIELLNQQKVCLPEMIENMINLSDLSFCLKDPQLCYKVERDKTYILKYEKVPVNEQVGVLFENIKDNFNNYQCFENRILEIEREKNHWEEQYHAIVSSRKWKFISNITRFIKFWERK